jgi:carbamoyltransferase
LAEERLTRCKSAGGFHNSILYCLDQAKVTMADPDIIVVSSCCEEQRIASDFAPYFSNRARRIVTISHHLSHAYSAFFASPFEKAIIIVMDAGGNTLEPIRHREWWNHSREQNTYYIGEGSNIKLIGRDFDAPGNAGFGEVYRAFTYYLGWPSSIYSGNTMALAAYGDPDAYATDLIFHMNSGGKLESRMTLCPSQPIDMIKRFAHYYNIDLPHPRIVGSEISQAHADLARFVQDNFEKSLIDKIRFLVTQTGIPNLCMAGGVSLNCVANAKILTETPVERIFIQPACK